MCSDVRRRVMDVACSTARFSHLAGFYGLACLLTWSCWLPILAEKHRLLNLHGHTELLATLGQFGPFTAAIFWTWIERGGSDIRDLFRRMVQVNVSPSCLVVALLLPPVLFSAAIGINVWLGNQTAPALQFPEPVGTTLHFLINLRLALLTLALGQAIACLATCWA